MTTLIQVALPTPMYTVFDYAVIDHLPAIGCRVQVPFGRQKLIGMVVAHIPHEHSQVPKDKLKTIIQCIDDTPIFDDKLMTLAFWLSSYYHYPLGETLSVMLPALLRQGKSAISLEQTWHLSEHAYNDDFVATAIKAHAKKQQADFEIVRQHNGANIHTLQKLGLTPKSLQTLADKGLITKQEQAFTPKPPTLKQPHLTLNDEQRLALAGICQAIDKACYQGFLLNGVTGSGKTEIYLQAIDHALKQGKQVLVMIPEIGLTPQSHARFAQRFDANIIILHSGLNDSERLAGWQRCQDGFAQIIIATRSSLFYPFANLGLIIIDEAHDASFKQQDHLRYHACDVALYLGFCQKIPVVLGSATPSLEQYKLANDSKLTQYRLTQRAGNAKPPTFTLVDMRLGQHHHHTTDGSLKHSIFAPQTITAIAQTLAQGNQVMVFINRRGYAPILLCGACGWQADCVRCSSHLTLHKSPLKHATHANAQYLYNHLKCHHCGYQVVTPTVCPECRSGNLVNLGQGTSGIYETLHAIFANPQTSPVVYSIVQIDRDNVATKGAWQALYAQINRNEPMILIGTQMIAKGHHFEKVALVVVADADAGFLSPNFRSPEHTAQTIIQVAGRAGRANQAGKVLIQSYRPDNPALQDLVRFGYEYFAQSLLKERQSLGLPPFGFAVLIQAKHKDYATAKNAIEEISQALPKPHPFLVLAPINAPLLKKNDIFCVQMLIISQNRTTLHQTLNTWWYHAMTLPTAKKVSLSIDIDPTGW